MKKIFTFIVLIACIACNENATILDWEKDSFKGKVKSITTRAYEVENKFGEWIKTEEKLYYYKDIFDENGKHIQENEYIIHGNLLVTRNNYNENGLFMYNSDGDLDSKCISISKSYSKSKSEHTYQVLDKDDNLKHTCHDVWEKSKGHKSLTATTTYPDGGKKITNIYWKQDKNSNVIEKTYSSDGSSGYERYEYLKYDDKGNWTERLVFISETSTTPEILVVREIEYFE